jgi:hypothetical protein
MRQQDCESCGEFRLNESYAGTARLPERRSTTQGSKRVESSVGSGEFTLFTERIAVA